MTFVTPQTAASDLEGILSHRPELLEKYRAFYIGFWRDGLVPRRVLELCRRRIAWIQDCTAELAISDAQVGLSPAEEDALRQGSFVDFDEAEQSALELAELLPHGVHFITDEMVERATGHFGKPGCVALLTALSFMDVNCRLKLVFGIPAESTDLSADAIA